jgi:hypothetical protein
MIQSRISKLVGNNLSHANNARRRFAWKRPWVAHQAFRSASTRNKNRTAPKMPAAQTNAASPSPYRSTYHKKPRGSGAQVSALDVHGLSGAESVIIIEDTPLKRLLNAGAR